MKIITDSIPLSELRVMAAAFVGSLVKAVVDVEREVMAVGDEKVCRKVTQVVTARVQR